MVTKLGQGHIFYLYVKDKKSKCNQVRGTFFYLSWPETKAQVMKFFSLSVVVVVVVNFLHLYFLLILTKFGTKHSWEKGFGFFLYYLLFFITFTNFSYIHCWSISTHSSFIWQCNNSFGISTTFLTYDVHENIVIWWLIMLWKFFFACESEKEQKHESNNMHLHKNKREKKVKQKQDKKKSCTLNYNC